MYHLHTLDSGMGEKRAAIRRKPHQTGRYIFIARTTSTRLIPRIAPCFDLHTTLGLIELIIVLHLHSVLRLAVDC